MRGIVTFIAGLFLISVLALVMGVLLEPIAVIVQDSSAVQALGWETQAVDIRDTILRWIPLLFIGYILTWAGMWALRRERRTEVRR